MARLLRERRGATRISRATTRTSTRRDAVRAAKGVRRPPNRGRHGDRAGRRGAAPTGRHARARAKFFGGDPEGKIGNSAEFRDIYEITKGSRPWFVIDPPDGKIPPILPEARARIASAAAHGKLRQRTVQQPRGLQPVGSLHHARPAGSMLPGSTATPIRSCRGPASSPSATRWCTRRA